MASRFWVGGSGTWDASDTTHWSGSSGAAGGVSVPGAADTVTFDGSSGGGTVVLATAPTITALVTGAFTGTLDFATNNNNITITGTSGWNGSGSGTRTINLGSQTVDLQGVSATIWNWPTVTGLTWSAGTSTIKLSGAASLIRTFAGGGLTYNVLTLPANPSGGLVSFTGANTFATFNVAGQQSLSFPSSTITTITNAFTWSGAPGASIGVEASTAGTTGTISVASGAPTMSWAGIRDMTFQGGATFTATNSFDLGHNSGITITPPAVHVIGG